MLLIVLEIVSKKSPLEVIPMFKTWNHIKVSIYRNIENIEVSIYRNIENIDVSIYRNIENIEVSIYRNIENIKVSTYRNIERVWPFIPWHPRVLYAVWTTLSMYRISKSYRLVFLIIGLLSNSIPISISNPKKYHCPKILRQFWFSINVQNVILFRFN